MWLQVETTQRRTVQLEVGTLVGLSGVVPHWFKSDASMSTINARPLSPEALGPGTKHTGGLDLLIGHAPLESLAFTSTVTGAVIVPADASRHARRIQHAIEAIEDELCDPDPAGGASAVVRRLSETILMNIARHVLAATHDAETPLAAIGDRRLMRAIAAVARAPLEPWTVEAMAEVAGMSRTAFAKRFQLLMSDTPLRMVARLRLRMADDALHNGANLDDAAIAAGYGSAAAFSRAFHRVHGVTPGQWRHSPHRDD